MNKLSLRTCAAPTPERPGFGPTPNRVEVLSTECRHPAGDYQSLFELNPNPMWIFDEATLRFLAVNEAAVKLYGWSPAEFRRLTVKDIRPPEEVPKLEQILPRQRDSRAAFVGQWRHWTKDHRVFDVEVTVSCFPFQGRDARLVMVCDITERNRAEQDLRESAAELERRVQQRTAELRHANQLLVLEMKRRRELESQVLDIGEGERCQIGQDLHDNVCSQLSGIEYLCQALAQDLAGTPRGTRRQVTKIIGLLQESMSDARKLAQGLCPLSLEAPGLLLGLKALAVRTRNIYRCRCAFRGNPAAMIADPPKALHLYRIAQEAVANAVKHSQARRLGITLTARGRAVVLKVWDNGVGLTSHPPSHQGLGLLTMEIRAHALGGALAVQRNRQGGTSVVCTVPNCLKPSQTRRRP